MEDGVVGTALVPHPPILFEEIGGKESERVAETKAAMSRVAGWIRKLDAQVLIVISPHGPLSRGGIVGLGGSSATADFARFGVPDLAVDLTLDEAVMETISELCSEADITLRLDPASADGADHGVGVPLLALRREGVELPTVVFGYPAFYREDLWRFGNILHEAAKRQGLRAVVIASGDLSHRLQPGAPAGYDPRAGEFDLALVRAFRRGEPDALWELPTQVVERAGECGYLPVLVALAAAKAVDPDPVTVLYSYQGPFGVGYAVGTITPREYVGLLDPSGFARESIRHYLREGKSVAVPGLLSDTLASAGACFVTLHLDHQLRGCIGTVEPVEENLASEIIRNSIAAATRDPRFPPVDFRELGDMEISVDVLSDPEPADVEDLDPKRYGVIVSVGGRRGLLLPDIAGIDDVKRQLEVACQKAGIAPDSDNYEISRFEVDRYGPS
ncbi:MAG: AmmeMemoRadiSam system protein A [Bacillota bacterium]